MRSVALAYGVGLLFGAGLVVSGMTQPAKVVSFLDLLGGWDASLAFVMGGAIVVHTLAYRQVAAMARPLWSARWSLPTRVDVDHRLLLGAALFGAGWGLGGYCPGPAITAVPAGAPETVLFTGAMIVGMWAVHVWEAAQAGAPKPQLQPQPLAPVTDAATSKGG